MGMLKEEKSNYVENTVSNTAWDTYLQSLFLGGQAEKCEFMASLSYVMIPCPGKRERQKRGGGEEGKEKERDWER